MPASRSSPPCRLPMPRSLCFRGWLRSLNAAGNLTVSERLTLPRVPSQSLTVWHAQTTALHNGHIQLGLGLKGHFVLKSKDTRAESSNRPNTRSRSMSNGRAMRWVMGAIGQPPSSAASALAGTYPLQGPFWRGVHAARRPSAGCRCRGLEHRRGGRLEADVEHAGRWSARGRWQVRRRAALGPLRRTLRGGTAPAP